TLAECGGPVSAESQEMLRSGLVTDWHSERLGDRQLTAGVKRAKADHIRIPRGSRDTSRPTIQGHQIHPPTPPPGEEPLRVTAAEVRRTLQRINPRKAAGPDNISGRVLKGCAYQLTEVLTDIFNTSLQQAAVPTCLKTATIIPIPKTPTVTGLNDYRPVALTPIVMKCFERLVMAHILHQPQHRLPPGLCAEPPPVHPAHTHDCSAIHPSCLI
ncbi:hypothetical protein L3Q82_009681, partial [Scortum barcoo]